jgi:hypothetical protein
LQSVPKTAHQSWFPFEEGGSDRRVASRSFQHVISATIPPVFLSRHFPFLVAVSYFSGFGITALPGAVYLYWVPVVKWVLLNAVKPSRGKQGDTSYSEATDDILMVKCSELGMCGLREAMRYVWNWTIDSGTGGSILFYAYAEINRIIVDRLELGLHPELHAI